MLLVATGFTPGIRAQRCEVERLAPLLPRVCKRSLDEAGCQCCSAAGTRLRCHLLGKGNLQHAPLRRFADHLLTLRAVFSTAFPAGEARLHELQMVVTAFQRNRNGAAPPGVPCFKNSPCSAAEAALGAPQTIVMSDMENPFFGPLESPPPPPSGSIPRSPESMVVSAGAGVCVAPQVVVRSQT